MLQSPRPRAADDFATIRARMEELRRERAEPAAEGDIAPRAQTPTLSVGSRPTPVDKRNLQAVIRRLMSR